MARSGTMSNKIKGDCEPRSSLVIIFYSLVAGYQVLASINFTINLLTYGKKELVKCRVSIEIGKERKEQAKQGHDQLFLQDQIDKINLLFVMIICDDYERKWCGKLLTGKIIS
jgi:hypothetical protein